MTQLGKLSTSEEMALSTNSTRLYIPLINEGTDVVRPTEGVRLGPDLFLVEATDDYDPELEEWAFPPGSRVKCQREIRGGIDILVARELATPSRAV